MNVNDALDQIADIRLRMAQSLTFRGYRAGTTLATAHLALLAGLAQAALEARDGFRVDRYLAVWLAAALIGLALVAGGCALRQRGHALEASLTLAAAESFLPSIVAGVLATYAITYHGLTPERLALLPGLWMLLFSLGLFASRRLLPGAAVVPASFYLLAGVYAFTLPPRVALSPWTMSLAFGIGQLLSAAILYATLERPDRMEARDA